MRVSRSQLMLAATIQSLGMGLASFPVGVEMDETRREPNKRFSLPPREREPITDTTPESKRARRRRLARERNRP